MGSTCQKYLGRAKELKQTNAKHLEACTEEVIAVANITPDRKRLLKCVPLWPSLYAYKEIVH